MAPRKGKRATMEQMEVMVDFLELHPEVAFVKFSQPNSKSLYQNLWEELAVKLNRTGYGAVKSSYLWRKTWQDWRSNVKAKHRESRQYALGNGEGPSKKTTLSEIEEKVLKLICRSSTEAFEEIPTSFNDHVEEECTSVKDPSEKYALLEMETTNMSNERPCTDKDAENNSAKRQKFAQKKKDRMPQRHFLNATAVPQALASFKIIQMKKLNIIKKNYEQTKKCTEFAEELLEMKKEEASRTAAWREEKRKYMEKKMRMKKELHAAKLAFYSSK